MAHVGILRAGSVLRRSSAITASEQLHLTWHSKPIAAPRPVYACITHTQVLSPERLMISTTIEDRRAIGRMDIGVLIVLHF